VIVYKKENMSLEMDAMWIWGICGVRIIFYTRDSMRIELYTCGFENRLV
jgi:hypothetical protein